MKQKKILTYIAIVIGILAVVGIGAFLGNVLFAAKERANVQTEEVSIPKETPVIETSVPEETPMLETSAPKEEVSTEENLSQEAMLTPSNRSDGNADLQEGLTNLKAQLESMLAGYSGSWSVYVEDLEQGEYLSINNYKMRAASLIKLYIMGAVYEAFQNGTLEYTEEIQGLLTQMITVSDNEASNELVRRLSSIGSHEDGMTVVNTFAQAKGYTDTSQGRDLKDFRETPPPGENYTSVNDCGKFLRSIYEGTCISEEASAQMTALLRDQERTWKIPSGLPEGVGYANKTGELSDVEHDVAIVYGAESGARDYIVCVMSEQVPNTGEAQVQIQNLSSQIYTYFQQ